MLERCLGLDRRPREDLCELLQLFQVSGPNSGKKTQRFRPEIVSVGISQAVEMSIVIKQRRFRVNASAQINPLAGIFGGCENDLVRIEIAGIDVDPTPAAAVAIAVLDQLGFELQLR